MSLDPAARTVLSRFPTASPVRSFVAQGNRGGFSGARLWRVEAVGGLFCLRAWPVGGPSSDRLHEIHRLMTKARSAGLSFVPAVYKTWDHATTVEFAGR